MNNIIGRWSTSWFSHDPADEVLVFLPDGCGVFEYYWWRLSSYDTFAYEIEDGNLLIIGDMSFSYDQDQRIMVEEPSPLQFSGKFQIREVSSEESISGCEVILELSEPLNNFSPHTSLFGRKAAHKNVSDYKPPTFWEAE
ncbi:MAG: hypothetical protein HC804_10590 [Anaerolineae bacterium]|nr:hypothetical protein [Anaerolineae bacterium]